MQSTDKTNYVTSERKGRSTVNMQVKSDINENFLLAKNYTASARDILDRVSNCLTAHELF